MAIKDAWALLIADAKCITKALGSDEQSRLTLALQQGIGSHGGAHLHALDERGGDGLTRAQTQQMANARYGRVPVLLGVLAEQFVGDQHTVWPLADDVGEGAAAVDPKLPAVGCGCSVHR